MIEVCTQELSDSFLEDFCQDHDMVLWQGQVNLYTSFHGYHIGYITYLAVSWLGLTYVRYIPKCSKRIQNRRIFSDFAHTFLLLLFYTISIYQNLFRIAAFLMIFYVLLMSLFKFTLFMLFPEALFGSFGIYTI